MNFDDVWLVLWYVVCVVCSLCVVCVLCVCVACAVCGGVVFVVWSCALGGVDVGVDMVFTSYL